MCFWVCDTQFVYVLEFVLLIAMMFIVCIGCVAYSFLGSLCLVSKFNFCAEVTNNIILLHYLVYMSAIIFEIFAVQILSNANIGVCLEIFFHLGLFVVTYYKNLSRKLKLDGKHGNCWNSMWHKIRWHIGWWVVVPHVLACIPLSRLLIVAFTNFFA